ncbi:MAG: redoxin domain-containing protein [SAR324 cluster bacterium]|nr:redoxin domain-containing protein [SAR324 cluster bacterium]MCH8887684.1 redoxin domain-containing protein [SAR324 cluster bacterium]
MNKPALSDASGEVWVLGASAGERAAVLQSLQAPDFTLPDLDGRPHSLSDFRGKKVFLVSWASW